MKSILASLGLITLGDEWAWAVTSPDGVYRYLLGRMWDEYFDPDASVRPLWVFGMLNPSKARHDVDDPTLRKCIGFARRGHAGGLVIVNMLAYSTPHPTEMVRAWRNGVDVRGPLNEEAIGWATSRPAMLGRHVAAWGGIPPRLVGIAQRGITQFLCAGPCDCLGVTRGGSPRHPLMLGYDTPLVPLAEARRAA